MDRRGQIRLLFLIALTATIVAPRIATCENVPKSDGAATTNPIEQQRAAVVESLRHDASLADVSFVDANTGWAVGDRGVIWHTQDGGATWHAQSSSVHCALNSVYFADAHCGWIAGGEYEPFSGASHGVILRTEDGGNTWAVIVSPSIPRLQHIKFFDTNRGIAVGEATPTQPSGVLRSEDGGQTWQPVPAEHAGNWLTGDFTDEQSGAVAGYAGQFGSLARGKIVHPPGDAASRRAFRAMQLTAPTGGWLVGDGGLVLTTKDLGRSWHAPDAPLPEFTAEHFDFQALATRGSRIWIAGTPGTRIFHSADNGKTWQSLPTGQSTPIRALTFTDENHGYAVGDLGAILATSDGGRTWTTQRSGASRVALLGIYANAADAPLEILAASSAAEGYVAAVEVLHSNTNNTSNQAQYHEPRACEALLLAGASSANTAWRFPLPPDDLAHSPADLLAALNRETDGRALEQIERHLVRAIRTWRPEVIVTGHTDLDTCEPRAAILAALLMQSIEAAADPARHARLAAEADLPPWQVKKVYSQLPAGTRGVESIAVAEFSPWLGTTPTNFVTASRQLLTSAKDATRNQYEFAILASTIQDTRGSHGLFNGITLSPGSDARRPLPQLPTENLDQLKRSADRRRHVEALLKHTDGNAAWVAQINGVLEDINPNDGAELLAQLADGYRIAGRLDLAADTDYLLARRFPDHALAARSLQWLIHFYASIENAHRLSTVKPNNLRQAGLSALPLPLGEGRGEGNAIQQTAATLPADNSPAIALSRDDRLHRATKLAEYLRTSRPDLYNEPPVRFAEVTALRELGFANPAKRYFLTLRQLPEANPWRRCGETELWLSQPGELPPPKKLGACRPANSRPHLDGTLDEPFWQTADRLRLSDNADNAPNQSVAHVRLAYDDTHLYIAIHCPKSANLEYPSTNEPRPRDADLSQHDRVRLQIDIDRDFTTAYELTVDSRGHTHDACCGDNHWNPTWYVAHSADDDAWTIEAAIPMAELTATPPSARHVWALSACRTIPRTGHQSWTGDFGSETSDQFGLLIFE